jgi:hypothetical protein
MEDANSSIVYDIKFFEKNKGLTPTDLLIMEIKKPNRPQITKNQPDSILRKGVNKSNTNIFSLKNEEDHLYKDPKVRISI